MNGAHEVSRSPAPILIPSATQRVPGSAAQRAPATGEGSRKHNVGSGQGLLKAVSAPSCHVLFVPWQCSVRAIVPCACGKVPVERE
jgi:hypothetical protein